MLNIPSNDLDPPVKPEDDNLNCYNIPNLLTLLRLALAPVFVYFLSHGEAVWAIAACFTTGAAMGVTDILDGYIGRRLNQITDLGKILDPTVDKIAAVTMLGGLYWFRELPLAFIVFKVIKELLFLPHGIIALRRSDKIRSASRWGKASCVILFAAMIPYVLDVLSETRVYWLWITAAVEIIALAGYYVDLLSPKNGDT